MNCMTTPDNLIFLFAFVLSMNVSIDESTTCRFTGILQFNQKSRTPFQREIFPLQHICSK